MEDQLQRRIQLFLQEGRRRRGTKTDGSGAALGTATGTVRNENQDRAIIVEGRYAEAAERDFTLAALCDGMGGMSQGEDAAILALSTFVARILRRGRAPSDERLDQAVRTADRVVHRELHGKGGATLTAVLIERNGMAIGVNVGDSRLYQIVHDDVRQLSRDDTIAEYLRSAHTQTESASSRREILQFVGIGEGLQPHLLNIPRADSDAVLLLTSDGAHDVPHDVFNRVVTLAESNVDRVHKLLNLADSMGGIDNSTLVAVPQIPFRRSAAPPDVGMTFRLWSPFAELEIWIPSTVDHSSYGTPPSAVDETRTPIPEKREAKPPDGGRKGKHARKPRKPDKSAHQNPPPPELDIEFPEPE